MTLVHPLVSKYDTGKWNAQKRVARYVHYGCLASLVIIVLTGTSAVIFIGRVTIHTRKKLKSITVPRTVEPTADHLRTVDEVIDQFVGTNPRSQQAQPLSFGLN